MLDLFCGIGTIALVLALDAGEVWGVELVEEAVADAIENARLNGIDNAQFFAGDVRTAMRPLLERSGKPDVVVVDPPRAGLSQKVVRRVLEAEAERVVYVSCNPTTLAPNARQMADAGYVLETVRPGGHVPADAAHRVRGAAAPRQARLAPAPRRSSSTGTCSLACTVQRKRPSESSDAWISWSVSCTPHSAQVRSITGSRLCSSRSTAQLRPPPPSPRSPRRAAPAARWRRAPCAAGPRAATSRP